MNTLPPFIKSLGKYQLRGNDNIVIYKGTREVPFEQLTIQEQYEFIWFTESYIKPKEPVVLIYNHYKLTYYIKKIVKKLVSYLRSIYLCSINLKIMLNQQKDRS